ncbi:MAG: PspC domain-containing protein [Pseudonocardia sp.]
MTGPTAPPSATPTVRPPTPPLQRRRSGRFVAGVAGGVADHLAIDVFWVRLTFAVLVPLGGLGVPAYGLLWMFVPQERDDVVRVVPAAERRQAWGLLALAVAAGLVASALGDNVVGFVLGPLGVVAIGAAVVWREADRPVQPGAPASRWRRLTRPAAVLRVVSGIVFVATGLGVFLLGNLDVGQVRFGLLAVLATLLGVAVLTIPWWLRLVRDLADERRARIVTAERAEIAAHLHDSVLQTLALIQRQAEHPREVLRLARGQERELRSWLYGPGGYHSPGGAALDAGFTEALAAAAAEVEDTYAVTVSPVVVGGDRTLDDGLRALVLAAREAMVNAAKHAQVPEVSVYAEVEPGEVHVFVRDRGVGFDPAQVPEDRHGLADSVNARMRRHGGTVALRSAPAEGTEVHLVMPVGAQAEPPNGTSGRGPAEPPAETPIAASAGSPAEAPCSEPVAEGTPR